MFDKKETHIIIPVILALSLSYIISVKNWDEKYKRKRGILPSGPVIGVIWILLFSSLGYAHYIMYEQSGISLASVFLIIVLLYCISYPLLTQLNYKKGRIMNTFALILSSLLLLVVFNENQEAFKFVVPLFLWTSFVNYSDAIVCTNYLPKK